jgi:hypothetical protein
MRAQQLLLFCCSDKLTSRLITGRECLAAECLACTCVVVRPVWGAFTSVCVQLRNLGVD